MTPQQFIDIAMKNPANAALADRLPSLGLQQCFLTAGCLVQAIWNRLSGRPEAWGVKDYDVFYFDDSDLSWEAEDAVIKRVRDCTNDLGLNIEVKNQARVHLWYERRFGTAYPQLCSASDGINRYPVLCTCIGINVDSLELHAPYGLTELNAGILRINPQHVSPALFLAKAKDYQLRWPWLTISQSV